MSDLDLILARLAIIEDKISSIPQATAAPTLEIINSDALCKKLDISRSKLYMMIKQKKIPVIRIGKDYRFNFLAVVNAIENKSSKKC